MPSSAEHADPFVRKVAMYWMSRIVRAHMSGDNESASTNRDDDVNDSKKEDDEPPALSAATISVRNSLPHVLPGILLR